MLHYVELRVSFQLWPCWRFTAGSKYRWRCLGPRCFQVNMCDVATIKWRALGVPQRILLRFWMQNCKAKLIWLKCWPQDALVSALNVGDRAEDGNLHDAWCMAMLIRTFSMSSSGCRHGWRVTANCIFLHTQCRNLVDLTCSGGRRVLRTPSLF